MKLFFLTQTTDQGPASRVRGYQMAEALKKLGCKVSVSPGVGSLAYGMTYGSSLSPLKIATYSWALGKRVLQLNKMKQFDLIYIQKEVFPHCYPLIERVLTQWKIPFVFDFDDALFSRGHRPNWLPLILKHAAGVTVGNKFLAEYAENFQKNVTVLPSCIQTESIKLQKSSQPKEKITLGWIGSRSSWKHFLLIWPVLKKLLYKNKNLSLLLMGIALPKPLKEELKEGKVEFWTWSQEREADFFEQIDIGLAPLTDTGWSEGKCGYKALQYMGHSIPVIASPIGIQKEILEAGKNGLCAENLKEWQIQLTELIKNKSLWKRMGKRGFKKVEEEYSFEAQAPKLKDFFQKILKKKR